MATKAKPPNFCLSTEALSDIKSNNITFNMELLAPAKDLETLICAFDAGADAVYAGLKKFSARARAKNLTIEELYKASEIKKKINKKLYIALNTLIFENEMHELMEILPHLKSAQIDGLIIQ
ncbi:MAG: hypothetical protein N2999_08155, partial [Proteobacteria bacterium]|nr:hypothetical protein [Pseudomonadota bacterium]